MGYLYDERDAAALCRELRRQATQMLSKESPKPSVTVMGSGSGPVAAAAAAAGPGSTAHSSRPGATAPHRLTHPSMSVCLSVYIYVCVVSGYDKQNWKDVKRLGYSSATLKIEVAPEAPLTGSALARARKDMLKLPAALFCQSVLAYQLRSHEEFLANFSRVFRRLDSDVDGSLCRLLCA